MRLSTSCTRFMTAHPPGMPDPDVGCLPVRVVLQTWELGVAGVSPIHADFVENVDLTDLVPGHLALSTALPAIMARLKLEE